MNPDMIPGGPGPDDAGPDGAAAGAGPTPEQYAARAQRANRATKGALAGVLGLEALVVLLLPRALAFSHTGLGVGRTVTLIVFALVLVYAAAAVRRSWGIGLGSVLQLALIATGFWLWGMFIVGALFAAVWVRILVLRHEVVGTPGGLKMLYS